jgi:glucokinase
VNGKLLFGRHGRAAELGHQIILPGGPLCGCGNRGCLEAVATAAPFAHQAGYDTPHEAVEAARAGDKRAIAALDTIADLIGLGISNMVTVFVPQRVVIGGGIATAGDLLLDRIRAATHRHQSLVPADWYDVVPATLGSYAGSIGASLWGLESA